MDEDELAEQLPKVLTVGLALAAVAAVVGVVVKLDRTWDRAYTEWSREMSPLTKPRARILRFKTTYRRRKLDAADLSALVNELWDEIDLARALRR